MTLDLARTFGLFVATALAEVMGCHLPHLWLKQGMSAWLLTLHPQAAGGVYVGLALLWLWGGDAMRPTLTDWVDVGLCLLGMAVIMPGARQT